MTQWTRITANTAAGTEPSRYPRIPEGKNNHKRMEYSNVMHSLHPLGHNFGQSLHQSMTRSLENVIRLYAESLYI